MRLNCCWELQSKYEQHNWIHMVSNCFFFCSPAIIRIQLEAIPNYYTGVSRGYKWCRNLSQSWPKYLQRHTTLVYSSQGYQMVGFMAIGTTAWIYFGTYFLTIKLFLFSWMDASHCFYLSRQINTLERGRLLGDAFLGEPSWTILRPTCDMQQYYEPNPWRKKENPPISSSNLNFSHPKLGRQDYGVW